MSIYVVMEPPGRPVSPELRDIRYVRDGFSLLAFLVPAVWLLWRRLWIEGTLVLALSLCLTAFGGALGLGGGGIFALSLVISTYVGLEGPALYLAELRRRGWTERNVVRAHNKDEAETRFLSTAIHEGIGEISAIDERATRPAARSHAVEKPLDLFDHRGGR